MVYCFLTLVLGANDAPTEPLSAAVPVTLTNDDVVELSCTR